MENEKRAGLSEEDMKAYAQAAMAALNMSGTVYPIPDCPYGAIEIDGQVIVYQWTEDDDRLAAILGDPAKAMQVWKYQAMEIVLHPGSFWQPPENEERPLAGERSTFGEALADALAHMVRGIVNRAVGQAMVASGRISQQEFAENA